MQTVWSRVAQVRCICNCPSCLSTTNAIARRTTTAAARPTVPVGNVVTLSLSSLAAGLAFVDSKKKDDRMRQWDKAIGEARATVEATEIQLQNRLAALSDIERNTLDARIKHEQPYESKWTAKRNRMMRPLRAALEAPVLEQKTRLAASSDVRGETRNDRIGYERPHESKETKELNVTMRPLRTALEMPVFEQQNRLTALSDASGGSYSSTMEIGKRNRKRKRNRERNRMTRIRRVQVDLHDKEKDMPVREVDEVESKDIIRRVQVDCHDEEKDIPVREVNEVESKDIVRRLQVDFPESKGMVRRVQADFHDEEKDMPVREVDKAEALDWISTYIMKEEALGSRESERQHDLVVIPDKEEEALETLESEGWDDLVPIIDKEEEALETRESKGQDDLIPIPYTEKETLDTREGEGQHDLVLIPNEEEKALEPHESEGWDRVPVPQMEQESLDTREGERQHDSILIPNEEEKALETHESEGWDRVPVPQMEPESFETWESEEQVHEAPLNTYEPDTWLDVFQWAREEQNIREASGFQGWKGPPLSLLQTLSEAQLHELFSNARLLRHFYGGEDCVTLVDGPSLWPFFAKKTRTLEWSCVKLVLKLLMYTFRYYARPWDEINRPTTSLLRQLLGGETMQGKLDGIQERLRILQADRRPNSYYEHFERPPFPNYDDCIAQSDVRISEMNASLQELLGFMEQRNDLGDILSKVFYILLTSRVPPNVDTYNMLLLRFSILRMDQQFKAVLESSCESRIRPNEITYVIVLQYFTASKDKVLFIDYSKRMRGQRRGLALAHPQRAIHPMLKERFHYFGVYKPKAAAKARMNVQVYESLIVGAIKYFHDQIAMRYYRSMVEEGWSPSFGILLAILQDCCRRLDWAGGHTVMGLLERTAESVNTPTYEWMLRLCQRCGQDEIFDQILLDGVHCGALPASMLSLSSHEKVEDIGFLIERAQYLQPRKAVGKSEEATAILSHVLDDKSPFLMENILHGCEDRHTLRRIYFRLKKRLRARRTLESRLDDISTDIEHTFLQANRILYALENTYSLKFWLTRRVKHLEQDLTQIANAVPSASYSDATTHQTLQSDQTCTPEEIICESDNLGNLPLTSHSFDENEAEHASHIPPVKDQQLGLVLQHPPHPRGTADLPSGLSLSCRDPDERMAAAA